MIFLIDSTYNIPYNHTYKGTSMEAKLTLKLDAQVISLAKKYAAQRQSSLSRLVETYFRRLVSERSVVPKYSPLVKELSGVISKKDLADLDYSEYLTNKYA